VRGGGNHVAILRPQELLERVRACEVFCTDYRL